MMEESPTESRPLLNSNGFGGEREKTSRRAAYDFIEGKTTIGAYYEGFTIFLILLNVLGFVVGTQFDATYVPNAPKCDWCGVWFIGTHELGDSSIMEIFTVAVFTVDYIVRFWAIAEEKEYQGTYGRLPYIYSFFSLVDLVSILPFYIDLLYVGDLPASQFLRMFRLFRMMRLEGRYLEAFTLFDDVLVNNAQILGVTGFVGFATWIIVSALYYLAERTNNDMIYCPVPCDTLVKSKCQYDSYGRVLPETCGCTKKNQCYNLFQSVLTSMYFTLVNLFGEFPLADNHSGWGRVVASFTAIIAVAIFGIPAGIFGNGFDELLQEKREQKKKLEAQKRMRNAAMTVKAATALGAFGGKGMMSMNALPEDEEKKVKGEKETTGDESTFRGRLFNFLHAKTESGTVFEYFIFALIILNVLGFMFETTEYVEKSVGWQNFLEGFETFSVIVFTIEYLLRLYAVGEVEQFDGFTGRLSWMWSFYALVDLLSILPWYGEKLFLSNAAAKKSTGAMFVRALRLLRMLKAEQYTEAFTILDDVVRAQSDVLIVTGFTALVFWIFFSTLMYYAERNNPDPEMQYYYYSIPDAMWMTLLNLSGESPLCHFTTWGKIITGVIGIFAVGLFGIPIGILGAGFEDWVDGGDDDNEDGDEEEGKKNDDTAVDMNGIEIARKQKSFRQNMFDFMEGKTSAGRWFEALIFALIFMTIVTTSIQTVDSIGCSQVQEKDEKSICMWMDTLELIAVLFFTVEYLARLYVLPEDPEYEGYPGSIGKIVCYIFSFYSIIDLLAIVPFYIASALPGGIVDQYDNYFRLLRIMRLFKLDKYVPSISLLDDVIRAKKAPLMVTGFAAGVLTVLFSALMYLTEYKDYANDINPIPLDGCNGNCTQANRFKDVFMAMPVTIIHLTGDFPIVNYDTWARVNCFFMVVIGVGLVSIPAGLIASGFSDVVEESQGADTKVAENYGGWELPTQKPVSPCCDGLMQSVNDFLNAEEGLGKWFSNFIFVLIIANIFAVVLETIPDINESWGEHAFNTFEAFSVIVFTIEYLGRVFSVVKDPEHFYSRYFYCTTFFGVVDFIAVAPWYVQQIFYPNDHDMAVIFRVFRLFRVLQLEHFCEAFTKLDDVYRESENVLKATGLMALIVWLLSGVLFYLFEKNNLNWREDSCTVQEFNDHKAGCNSSFGDIPSALYFTAIFLGGEWAKTDFSFPGKLLCVFLCVAGIAIYAVPIGALFDAFGEILGGDDDEEEDGDD